MALVDDFLQICSSIGRHGGGEVKGCLIWVGPPSRSPWRSGRRNALDADETTVAYCSGEHNQFQDGMTG